MKNAKRPRKLGFGPLALLDWLCEAGEGRRMFVQPASSSVWLFEVGEPGPDGRSKLTRHIPDQEPELLARLGGRGSIDTHGLTREGFEHYQHSSGFHSEKGKADWIALSSRIDVKPLGYNHNVWVPGPGAFRFWREEGKARLEAMVAERAEERRSADRLIVIKGLWRPEHAIPAELARKLPEGFRIPLQPRRQERAYGLARVVRETSTRIYVGEIERFRIHGKGGWAEDPVKGSAAGAYVEPESIMLDHATRRAALDISEIEGEHASEADEAILATLAEIAPALLNLSSRLAQKAARRADEIREAVESATPAGEPEEDEPASPSP